MLDVVRDLDAAQIAMELRQEAARLQAIADIADPPKPKPGQRFGGAREAAERTARLRAQARKTA